MSNITADFITATKKIHADVRAVLMALHLIGKDVAVIKEKVRLHGLPHEKQQSVRAVHAKDEHPKTYEAKQYALDNLRFRLEKKAFSVGTWTIVILAIYTAFTGYQSCQSKRSADAADIAAKAAKGASDTAASELELTAD
jgi:hypothetical protein